MIFDFITTESLTEWFLVPFWEFVKPYIIDELTGAIRTKFIIEIIGAVCALFGFGFLKEKIAPFFRAF